MIDWITCRIPVTLPEPIKGGETVILNRAGEIEKIVPHRLKVRGSFESSISIRAPSTSELEISGNPAKWLQGHNLYGTDCPQRLLWAALQRLEPHLGATLAQCGLHSPADLAQTIITRIDCTEMLALDNQLAVKEWLRAAYASGSASHRGRGVMREGTLVFGDAAGGNFARWQIVLYGKGDETDAHPLPSLMHDDAEVRAWIAPQLRAEVRLGRLELEKRGLRRLAGWIGPDAAGLQTMPEGAAARKMWSEKMGQLQFSDTTPVDEKLAALPPRLAGVYAQWKDGIDLRSIYTAPTFYRNRAAIRAAVGVDIAVPRPAGAPTARVVPIRRVLEARLSGRPAWADRVDAALVAQGCVAFPFAA